MVRTRRFWLLYVVFAVVNGVGLMLIEKVAVYATELGFSVTAATFAASLVALGQASGVIVIGTASDRVGRVRSLGGSLVCCAVALTAFVVVGGLDAQWAFVALAGVSMFFRSPSFSILPGLVGEYYGEEYSSENYAVMLTAKLWGGIYGGLGTSLLVAEIGWSPTFLLGAGLAFVAGSPRSSCSVPTDDSARSSTVSFVALLPVTPLRGPLNDGSVLADGDPTGRSDRDTAEVPRKRA